MPPKLGTLTADELRSRLEKANVIDSPKNLTRGECLELAKANNLVSELEYERTREIENAVRKRYLRTMVKDEAFLEAIDKYVVASSLIRAAGSKLANLFALEAYERGLLNDGDPEFLKRTLLNQTFVKYCLLPFKSAIPGDGDAQNAEPANPMLSGLWQQHRRLLEPLYPPVQELRFVAWDQPLNDMAREYCGTLKAHALTHLPSRLQAVFLHRIKHELHGYTTKDPELGRVIITFPDKSACFASDAYEALMSGEKPAMRLPRPLAALVEELRCRCGLAGHSRLDRIESLTPRLFKLHIELSLEAMERGAKGWSACPVIKTSRTFAFIDDRVLESLLAKSGCKGLVGGRRYEDRPKEDAGLSRLQWAFGVHWRAWEAANKEARNVHRKSRAASGRARAEKARCGFGKFPRDVEIRSIMTDGVALCVTLERLPKVSRATRKAEEKMKHEERARQFVASLELNTRLAAVSEDPGRANISQTLTKTFVVEEGPGEHRVLKTAGPGSPSTSRERFAKKSEGQDRLTRTSYLKRTLQDLRTAQETERRRGDRLLRIAIDHLGDGGACTWRTTDRGAFLRILGRLVSVQDILVAEYVESVWHARWKMLLWRRKQSVLAQHYSQLIRQHSVPGQPVIFGRGDGQFSATGRGEQSVPTKGAAGALHKTLGALRTRNPRSCAVMLGEVGTTLKCSRCHQVLKDVFDDRGRALRGIKECRGCCERPGLDHWCRLVKSECEKCKGHPESVSSTSQVVGSLSSVLDDQGVSLARLKACMVPQRTTDHTSRLVNRDANAARNLMAVLMAMTQGELRPEYLRKTRRQKCPPQPKPPVEDDEMGLAVVEVPGGVPWVAH